MPIVPTITSARHRWVFSKSWDRFMVPKPFSRVIIRFAEPVYVPEDLDTRALRTAAEGEQILTACMRTLTGLERSRTDQSPVRLNLPTAAIHP